MENPPKKFYRLGPGCEVRLRWGYIVKCTGVVKDERTGAVLELRCTHDPESRTSGRQVKGTVHWVSEVNSLPVELRLYDRLFKVPNPTADREVDFKSHLNPQSLEVLAGARAERGLADAKPGERFQFERKGYYFVDPEDSRDGAPVFNRIVPLRDTWAKIVKAGGG